MMYLVAFDAGGDASPTVETFRFATAPGFVTGPGDSPANVVFRARIMEAPTFSRYVFGRGRTRGRSDVGRGQLVLANGDGALDELLDYGFAGRAVTVWTVADERASWSSRSVFLVGVVDQVEVTHRDVRVIIRDRLALLDRPLQPPAGLFDGSNGTSPSDDISGTADDLRGQPKPMLFGVCRGVPAPQLNATTEIRGVNFDTAGGRVAVSSFDALYSGGASYTASGTDRADLAALKATTPPSAEADTCVAEGLLRTNGSHFGEFTCDVTEGATASDRTAAQIADAILARHGYSIASADVAALDAANAAVCGFYAGEAVAIIEAVQLVLQSIGAGLYTDASGSFRALRLEAPAEQPSGTIAAEFTDADLLDPGAGLERVVIQDEGRGIPPYRVTVEYQRLWRPLAQGEMAGSVINTAEADRQSRAVRATDPVVDEAAREKWPEAPELVVSTLLDTEAAAEAEAARLAALYGPRSTGRPPEMYRPTVAAEKAAGVDLGDVVTLRVSRFGLDAGRDFRVTGREDDATAGLVTLEVWG